VRLDRNPNISVMAGLAPAIHVFLASRSKQDVDARDERGHDVGIFA
jgi:hypothetical protein